MTGALEQVLRFGPFLLLATICVWLMIATRRTSSAIGGRVYGFGGTARQQAAQWLFRGAIIGGLVGTAGHAAGLEWPVLQPLFEAALPLRLAGLMLALAGQFLIVFAQSNMGRRWRVGVPDEAPDALVTTGLFAASRNPVFLGMLALAIGLALAVPSAVMIACTLAFWLGCEIQVRDEERFLQHAFGPAYIAYRSAVRRWI